MNAMRYIRINTAMLGLLVTIAVMMAVAIGLSMVVGQKMGDCLDTIKRVDIDQLNVVNEINNEQSFVRAQIAGMLDDVRVHREPDRTELAAIAGALDTMDGLLEKFNAVQKTPEQQELAQAISDSAGGLIKTIRGKKATSMRSTRSTSRSHRGRLFRSPPSPRGSKKATSMRSTRSTSRSPHPRR